MSGLAKIQAPPLTQNVAATAESKKTEDAKKVGQDFEAILVRQMLAQANLGGKGGYGDMATEALATAVTKGGGLGLGRMIEQQLAPHHGAATPTPPTSTPSTKVAPSAALSAFKKASGTDFSIPKK